QRRGDHPPTGPAGDAAAVPDAVLAGVPGHRDPALRVPDGPAPPDPLGPLLRLAGRRGGHLRPLRLPALAPAAGRGRAGADRAAGPGATLTRGGTAVPAKIVI